MKFGTMFIKDLTFDICDAMISGEITENGECLLGIDIYAATENSVQNWKPHAYLQKLPCHGRSLKELCASPIQIPSGATFCENRILPGCKLCCLYVDEHTWIDDSIIHLSAINHRWLDLNWTAKCAVNFDEQYGKNLPLIIRTPAEFLGFSVPEITESKAMTLLTKYFSIDGLKFHRESGNSYFLPAD